MKQIVFATNNKHKLEEIRNILDNTLNILSLDDINCHEDIPETGSTIEENALIKARYIKEKYGYDCFADDTGLEIKSLNNEPGVYSARYAGNDHNSEKNMQKVLENLKGKNDRSACFRTCIALITSNNEYLFEGKIEGEIITEKKGESGFGYDPIFVPDGYTQTFAELGNDIKQNKSQSLSCKETYKFFTTYKIKKEYLDYDEETILFCRYITLFSSVFRSDRSRSMENLSGIPYTFTNNGNER